MIKPLKQSGSRKRLVTKALRCCLLTPALFGLYLFAAYKIANRIPDITVPGHDVPADNALDYFHKAYRESRSMQHITPYDMSGLPAQDYTLANFRGCAIDAEPSLTILRQGLSHPCVNAAERSYQSLSQPIYAEIRELARIDAGAADYYAISGDPGRSMQIRLDGLEMAVMIPRGGSLLAFLVGRSCESIAGSYLEPLFPRLSNSELAETSRRLEQIAAKRVAFSDNVQEDGYMNAACTLDAMKHPFRGPLADVIAEINQDTDKALSARLSDSKHILQTMFANKAAMIQQDLDAHNALTKAAQGPYTNRTTLRGQSNPIAEEDVSMFNTARAQFAGQEAAIVVIQVEVALYQYHNKHGRFPQSLADLCPVYLRSVPSDPCSPSPAAALKYSITNRGTEFLLYSVGPDMKNDGGVPAKRIGEMGGDIVAGKLYKYGPILYTSPPKKQ